MTDDLDDLKAMMTDATPKPDATKRAANLALAQKNFETLQGSRDPARPTPVTGLNGLWTGVTTMLSTFSSKGGLFSQLASRCAIIKPQWLCATRKNGDDARLVGVADNGEQLRHKLRSWHLALAHMCGHIIDLPLVQRLGRERAEILQRAIAGFIQEQPAVPRIVKIAIRARHHDVTSLRTIDKQMLGLQRQGEGKQDNGMQKEFHQLGFL